MKRGFHKACVISNKNAKQRGEFESTMHWEKTEGDLSLCTYTTKSKSKGKKNVLVLSTMRPLMGITRDDGKQKPAIIKFYDFTKGGTDVMDQKISKYSCKSLTHCWTMIHFFYWHFCTYQNNQFHICYLYN